MTSVTSRVWRGCCCVCVERRSDEKDIQFTVQQAGVTAPKKIWEPPDMSLLHYFLNDQLSLSDSVLS